MKLSVPSPAVRRYLYVVSLAVFSVLVTYHVVDSSQVPEWLTLTGAILGLSTPAVALPAVNAKITEAKKLAAVGKKP